MKVYYDGNYKIINSSGKGKTYNQVNEINKYKFITEIEIEPGTTKIDNGAFYNCKSLKSIIIPDSVTEIGERAFACCESLESIKLPDSITKIDKSTFLKCKLLKEVVLPNNIKNIGDSTFKECTSLEKINLPKELTEIGNFAFSQCTSLTEIIIPESVIIINKCAFFKCYSLKNVIFDNPNLTIKFDTFKECNSLYPDIKEKIFYQITQDITCYDDISTFFKEYDKEYNSELIQELITINIFFFKAAKPVDQEVFLDAALDSINNIYEKGNITIVETDICNIIKSKEQNEILLSLKEQTLEKAVSLPQKYHILTNKIIKKYQEKEELDR